MANVFDAANIRVEDLNTRCENTMSTAIGLKFTEIGSDFLRASMEVNHSNCQPLGMLNGGASLAMIEIIGSLASNLALTNSNEVALGQAVTGNHFRPVPIGETVWGEAKPLHVGKKSHVWEVSIYNSQNKLVCKGSITMAVVIKN